MSVTDFVYWEGMREMEKDEAWIRDHARMRAADTVYVTANRYDGGYEVRVGNVDFFVDYESIDADDDAIFQKYL